MPVHTVALSGDLIPGTDLRLGSTFTPYIADGHVAFTAKLTGPGVTTANNTALFLSSGGGPYQMIARTGSPLGSSGTPIQSIGKVLLNAGGYVKLSNDDDHWVREGTEWSLWLQTPGTQVLTSSGQLLAKAADALYLVDGSSATRLIGDGDPAPGVAGATFWRSSSFAVFNHIGPDNVITFRANAVYSDGTTVDGIWVGTAGNWRLVAKSGDHLASDPDRTFAYFGMPTVGRGGDVTFQAGTTTSSSDDPQVPCYVFDYDLGTIVPFGPPPYVPGVAYPSLEASASRIAAGPDGHSVMKTTFSNSLLYWDRGQCRLLLTPGQRAPDIEVAGTLSSGSVSDAMPSKPAINGLGQVVIAYPLTRTFGLPYVTAANDYAIWSYDPENGLHLVLREGDLLEIAPGDVRRIDRLIYSPQLTGSAVVYTEGLLDDGSFVFSATFTDGTSGLFVGNINVPEPGSLTLWLPLALLLRRRTRLTPARARNAPSSGARP